MWPTLIPSTLGKIYESMVDASNLEMMFVIPGGLMYLYYSILCTYIIVYFFYMILYIYGPYTTFPYPYVYLYYLAL